MNAEISLLEMMGDSAAITCHTAHKIQSTTEEKWKRPSCAVSLHPNTRAEYSAIVRGIRNYYHEFDLTLYECSAWRSYSDAGIQYGTTDFYFCAEHAAQNHGRVEITVFWP